MRSRDMWSSMERTVSRTESDVRGRISSSRRGSRASADAEVDSPISGWSCREKQNASDLPCRGPCRSGPVAPHGYCTQFGCCTYSFFSHGSACFHHVSTQHLTRLYTP
ncbi:unnamed protein product, partial [Ectocarpus sp. 12 AP-2014]